MTRNMLAHALIITSELALSAPAVWWIVSLNNTVATKDADYLIHPLRLHPDVEAAIGLLSVLAIGHAARSIRTDPMVSPPPR